MRKVAKLTEPAVLAANAAAWLEAWLNDPNNATKRYRYRHPEIKTTLREETCDKCVYCESKVGHNTPGDVEHKVPSSKRPQLHFTWTNLTLACTECNRRKDAYYDEGVPFLDPYVDDVEDRLVHYGPILGWPPGDQCAEASIRTLELNSEQRLQLILRKIEKIQEISDAIERYVAETEEPFKALLLQRVVSFTEKSAEFSGLARTVIAQAEIL